MLHLSLKSTKKENGSKRFQSSASVGQKSDSGNRKAYAEIIG